MTQQDALSRAVCEHPDEDTPRLIFADHLEDCGDARRAAFIRTQVHLARVPEHDPFRAECRRRDPDSLRGWTMAHTLPRPPSGLSWRRFAFRRGFPWLASATDVPLLLRHGLAIFDTAPIQALELSHESGIVANWAAFLEWPGLAKLTRLEFTHTRLNAAAMRALGKTPNAAAIRELCFDSDAITADGLKALAESELFPRLRRLEIRRAALPPALATDAIAAAPPGLAELAIVESKLPEPDLAWLLAQPVCRDLTSIDLSGNPVRGETCAAAARATILRLEQTGLAIPSLQTFLKSNPRDVRLLDLSSNRLGAGAVRSLAECAALSNLTMLDLRRNPIGSGGALALAASPVLKHLVELDVRDCGLDADSVARLDDRFGPALRTDRRPVHRTPA